MRQFRLFLLLFVLLFAMAVHSQNVQPHLILSSFRHTSSPQTICPFLLYTPRRYPKNPAVTHPSLSVLGYDQHIAKGAVFCRLENHFCEHYNIWLKIRAGDVEEYHRQIEKKQ